MAYIKIIMAYNKVILRNGIWLAKMKNVVARTDSEP